MNPQKQVYSYLVFLQQKVAPYTINPPSTWEAKHVDGFKTIFKQTEKLLNIWNKAVVETSEGFEISLMQRNRVLRYITNIIATVHSLTRTMDDITAQFLLQEIDGILNEMGGLISEIGKLDESA